MSTRKALWVVSVSNLAGVARHVLDVANAGIEDWELSFILPEGPLADELRRLDWPTTTHEFGRDVGVARSLAALRRVIRRTSPDVVHSHLAWGDVVASWATPTEIPLVSTEHGVAETPHLYNRSRAIAAAKRLLHRRRMSRTDCIIPVSQATAAAAAQLWGLPRGITRVIQNGIDSIDHPSPPPRVGNRYGSFARLAPEKDYATMIRAFDLVHRRVPEATLELAGTGVLESWLREEIERRGLGRAVRLRGFMEPEDFFRQVEVVVQLSVWENCSYSVLDAVVHGKGTVATAVGGYLEYLPSHCLVPVGDARSAAERMVEQATDLKLRPQLPADWPSVDEMRRHIARVYGEVMASRAPPTQARVARPPEVGALSR